MSYTSSEVALKFAVRAVDGTSLDSRLEVVECGVHGTTTHDKLLVGGTVSCHNVRNFGQFSIKKYKQMCRYIVMKISTTSGRAKGPFKCYVSLFSWKFYPHPPPRNTQ